MRQSRNTLHEIGILELEDVLLALLLPMEDVNALPSAVL
jgi:hypothetical protein